MMSCDDLEGFGEARLADVVQESLPMDHTGEDLLILICEVDFLACPDAAMKIREMRAGQRFR